MAALGPFERRPFLAVAVSGGADSLALCLLAADWAQAHGGRAVALTVDHRLRAESAAEARQVASWLAARGIDHHTLVWRHTGLAGNRHAAARAARYRLLAEWCAASGCLHLLTAHHREDQAETLLLRLARGSGLDGLAGMAPIRELADCRILRPLLDVPRARLATGLREAGQGWIEDPSNHDPAYARGRLRALAGPLARQGLDPARLAGTAQRLGRARQALEAAVTGTLARTVALHPAGFARLDAGGLAACAPEIGLRALARLLATVGGGEFTARLASLEGLFAALTDGLAGGRTLAGCRLLPRQGLVLVCREPAAVEGDRTLPVGGRTVWDGRFAVELAAAAPPDLIIGALGGGPFEEPVRQVCAHLPAAVRATLPAVRQGGHVVALPGLGWTRADGPLVGEALRVAPFRPNRPLAAADFTVV